MLIVFSNLIFTLMDLRQEKIVSQGQEFIMEANSENLSMVVCACVAVVEVNLSLAASLLCGQTSFGNQSPVH